MKLITFNINFARNQEGEKIEFFADLVKNFDLIFLQRVEQKQISKLLPENYHWTYSPSLLSASRYPILENQMHEFSGGPPPSDPWMGHSLLETTHELPTGPLTVFNALPAHDDKRDEETKRAFEIFQQHEGNKLLLGDFHIPDLKTQAIDLGPNEPTWNDEYGGVKIDYIFAEEKLEAKLWVEKNPLGSNSHNALCMEF